jgi:tartrate dehydrogenase/decarboxylase / D-malate dehydrogenase
VGSIGIAPSANLNPPKKYPSLFEPAHGSAPDISDKGIANPIGQIWSAAMILAHLSETAAADAIEHGIEDVLTRLEFRTPDVGGKATTEIVGKAIADTLSKWYGKMAKNSEGTFWVSS